MRLSYARQLTVRERTSALAATSDPATSTLLSCHVSVSYNFPTAHREHCASASAMQPDDPGATKGHCMALPVKAVKAGQQSYWLDQISRNREEYFPGKGESPGRFVGKVAATSDLVGEATPKQVHACSGAWTRPPTAAARSAR